MYYAADVKRFLRCPRLFVKTLREGNKSVPYLRLDESLTKFILEKLALSAYYVGNKEDEPAKVIAELDNYEWFVRVGFTYRNLKVQVPFLHKEGERYSVYFTLYAPFPKRDDLDYYRIIAAVLARNGVKLADCYIIHLNNEYVRGAELDSRELFKISDTFYNRNGHPGKAISAEIAKDPLDLDTILTQMDAAKERAELPMRSKCHLQHTCLFAAECFAPERSLPYNSILTLVSSQYKERMYAEGRYYLKDADVNYLEGNACQYAQITADRLGGLFFDYMALKTWLAALEGRILAFVDFEWERYILPPFPALKPYDAVPFEFSLHLLYPDGKLLHQDFIGTKDCRAEFIESLLAAIPPDAIPLAYNAGGAEMLRIKELAEQFPAKQEALLALNARFVDMAYPFVNGLVYDTRMGGNYSVKSLIQVVSALNYADLRVSDGMEAVFKWREMDRDQTKDWQKTKEALLEYCSLDSYSLVLIYRWLKHLVSDPKDIQHS